MADLIVKPAYKFGPKDILDADKLNLLATPVVELALTDPVNDQNFFRNGNFYSSFWKTPGGVSCPTGVWTTNASYWLCRPNGAAVTFKESQTVPDQFSLFTAEILGAASVAIVEFGQQINGDLSATLRRKCTFSGYLYNSTGLTISPTLNFYTCNAFNNFAAITLQTTINLQTGANATWTYMTATLDVSILANVANGLLIAIALPAGSLNAAANNVLLSRLKFQIGEVATEFVDDPSLFVTAPSVDSTMLQDGCIARPTLFLPNVVPTGAYQAKSINNGDINDGAINGRTLAAGAGVANLGYTPVNKAGDTGVGRIEHDLDTVVGASGVASGGVLINMTSTNAANDGYYPAISFNRSGTYARTIGLSTTGRFKTVDHVGTIGFLLDTVTKVDTNSYQDGSITLQKLATSLINLIIPPGAITMFGGGGPPAGWLICDGTSYLTSTYPALFNAIGTYWGNGGDVSGAHFQVPDFQGRTPIGYVNKGAPGITARQFGLRGGNETHTLSVGEMPSHAHGVNDNQHTHTSNVHHHSYVNPLGSSIGVQTGPTAINLPAGTTNTSDTADSMLPASANISLQNSGGSAPHDIMQPFGVLYFIIKV
jgi:microcystin-dependent protein